ncbi:MAG: hypothetical protein ACRDIZ_06550 [Actinomycetota bacterium]
MQLATGVPHLVPHGNEWDLTLPLVILVALGATRIALGRLTIRGAALAALAALMWGPLVQTTGPVVAGLLAVASVAMATALHASVQPD